MKSWLLTFGLESKDAKMKNEGTRKSTVLVIIAFAVSVALVIYVAGKMHGEKVSIQTPVGKAEIIFQHRD
jgi:hypothetical protein